MKEACRREGKRRRDRGADKKGNEVIVKEKTIT